MPLREEFEKSGGWMFKWRSLLPVPAAGVCLLALWERGAPPFGERFAPAWQIACLAVCFFGLAIRVLTVGRAPRRTSGRNTKAQVAETLNTTGAYSLARHPLYLGNFFMGLGLVLYVQAWWLVLIYVLAFALYYERIMFAEEAFLREKFGEEYIRWSERTPAFFPGLRGYVRPARPFSLRAVLKREYSGFFAVILYMFLIVSAEGLIAGEKPGIDVMWIVLLSAGFGVWLLLRTLKKHTGLLRQREP